MKWDKQGRIYHVESESWWRNNSTLVPVPYLVEPERLRLYCGFRDDQGMSRIGFVDVEAKQPSNVLAVSEDPVLDIGRAGAFDDNGVVPTSIVKVGSKLYLYYFAFQLGARVRYFLFSGLAISEDNGRSFTRYSEAPILDRSSSELMFRSGPFVVREDDRFRLWYVAGSEWVSGSDKTFPNYAIHYAESTDGMEWPRSGDPCIVPKADEFGVGRPVVFRGPDCEHMIFSARSFARGYCPAYAKSRDGVHWERDDRQLGISRSSNGWDSEMICFHSVYRHQGDVFLFYCGNDFGREGMGYAVLRDW